MCLAQWGNGARGRNALVELIAHAPRSFTPAAVAGVDAYELGEVDGTARLRRPGAAPVGRLLFCAIAEAGESTYEDGACLGSAVGILGAGTSTCSCRSPTRRRWRETLASRAWNLLLVADDDDPHTPAPLLAGSLADESGA